MNFELTIDEANIVLQCLAKQPFEVVAPVITKLQLQAQSQIPQVSEEPEVEVEKKD